MTLASSTLSGVICVGINTLQFYAIWRWEKPQEGGVELCFQKLLSYVLKNCSQIQSLKKFRVWLEFRVLVHRIILREQRKKEHKQLYRFLPQTGSSPVPLALPRRVPLKCNVELQDHTRKRLLNAQGQLQETSMLNHYWKRLLCSRTTPRDFLCSITTERDF